MPTTTLVSSTFIPFVSGELSGPDNAGESKSFPFLFERGYAYIFRITYGVVRYLACRVSSHVGCRGINHKDSIVTPDSPVTHYLIVYSDGDFQDYVSVSSIADRYAPSVVHFEISYTKLDCGKYVVLHNEENSYPQPPIIFDYYEFPNGGKVSVSYLIPHDIPHGSIRIRLHFSYYQDGVGWVTSWAVEKRIESNTCAEFDVPKGVRGYFGVSSLNWNSDAGVISMDVEVAGPVPQPQPQPQPQPEPPSEYPDIWDVIKDYMSRIIHDELPCSIDPFITKMLISVNAMIFLLVASNLNEAIYAYGLIPAALFAGEWFRILTSMYLHADFLSHLGMNMTFLFVFGDNVEEATTWRYILYYHLFGIVAGLGYVAHAFAVPELWNVPAVGASGAVSGVLGYYFVRFPDAKVVFMGKEMSAYVFGALFFIEQVGLIFMVTNVAWSAHLAGLVAGVLMALLDKRYVQEA